MSAPLLSANHRLFVLWQVANSAAWFGKYFLENRAEYEKAMARCGKGFAPEHLIMANALDTTLKDKAHHYKPAVNEAANRWLQRRIANDKIIFQWNEGDWVSLDNVLRID